MAREFTRLFENATRVIDETVPAKYGLMKRANAQCRKAHRAQVLSVQPVKGTAVVFWNVDAAGRPNYDVWHSACQALAGSHRYALQKFKEYPDDRLGRGTKDEL
jgi:hypothetical protein